MKIEEQRKLIGARIKEARERSGMSQIELAEKIGFNSATAVSLMESGDRKTPAEVLDKIADVLHRDINFFLGKEAKQVDFGMALRADKKLSKSDQERILEFIDFVKSREGGKRKPKT